MMVFPLILMGNSNDWSVKNRVWIKILNDHTICGLVSFWTIIPTFGSTNHIFTHPFLNILIKGNSEN